jgi:hypothetical protein
VPCWSRPRYGRLWSRPDELQEGLRKRAAMAEEIEKALRAIGHGLEINIGVAGLNLWIRKRDRAIEAHGKLLAAERECREAQIETNGSRERIAEAMRLHSISSCRWTLGLKALQVPVALEAPSNATEET